MTLPVEQVIAQIDAVLTRVDEMHSRAQYSDLSDLPDSELMEVRTLGTATIDRLTSAGSAYRASVKEALQYHPGKAITSLAGILRAVRIDYEAGHLASVAELIHADTFSDLLEGAEHLLLGGYQDAAAVIAGAVLEQHLRALSQKNNLSVEDAGKPRSAASLNADLARAGAYSKLEEKSVTAWLGLRNEAAHGHYERYDTEQVQALVRDVRQFLVRHPA